MYKKFKLSVFISQYITAEQRKSKGFAAAIMFLPELYATHLAPSDTMWVADGYRSSRPMRDEFLHTPSEYFDYVHEGFEAATRVEIHILPNESFEIEFFNSGKTTGHKIVFSFTSYASTNDFGAGFIGGDSIR